MKMENNDTENQMSPERSLLDEIEELQVLEAEALQEGVAFHAFRFRSPADRNVMEAVVLTFRGEAAEFVDKIRLPRGATLMEVYKDTMLVVFDAEALEVKELQKHLTQSLGERVAKFEHDPKSRYVLSKEKAR